MVNCTVILDDEVVDRGLGSGSKLTASVATGKTVTKALAWCHGVRVREGQPCRAVITPS